MAKVTRKTHPFSVGHIYNKPLPDEVGGGKIRRFKTLTEAENFLAEIAYVDKETVTDGLYFLDGPEGPHADKYGTDR